MVLSYAEAITRQAGRQDAWPWSVPAASGSTSASSSSPTSRRRSNLKEWKAEWGAADPQEVRGALTTPLPPPPAREVYLLQRTKGAQGRRLGKTSGWVHRASLKAKGVQQLSGRELRTHRRRRACTSASGRTGPMRCVLEVDNVVICAGQESVRDLEDGLRRKRY